MGDEPSKIYLNYAGGFYRDKLHVKVGEIIKPGDLLQNIIDYFADGLKWGYTSYTYDTAQEVLYSLECLGRIKKTGRCKYKIYTK